MKTAKKTVSAPFLGLLVLLTLLLAACGNGAPTGSEATPTPTRNVTVPTPDHPDQTLVYVWKDSTNVWHIRRYDSRTGQKTDIYTTAAGQIKEAQVSADGQWVLFLTELYPAMQTDVSANIELIRMDGQSFQTLYAVAKGNFVAALEWSPDQRYIAFQEKLGMSTYLMLPPELPGWSCLSTGTRVLCLEPGLIPLICT